MRPSLLPLLLLPCMDTSVGCDEENRVGSETRRLTADDGCWVMGGRDDASVGRRRARTGALGVLG